VQDINKEFWFIDGTEFLDNDLKWNMTTYL
jgi:hypothetical protein